jgi:ATP-binding cassette subfamily C protein CydD
MTGLAGASGSGKSTIVRLLTGLARPSDGRIMVCGVDLAEFDPADWRSKLALVPQRPFFFKGTIRENLLLGCPDLAAAAVQQGLAAAAALDFVEQLPSGLDTQLGDRGAGLSGGELRRLALARAFLRNADLLVLDEPTSGLDAVNERLVGEALLRLAENRTVLLISHREETLALAQRVILLSGGRVEQTLSRAEYLTARGGS